MFKSVLEPFSGPAFAVLRLAAGLMFAFHGYQKLFGYQFPAEHLPHFPSQIWFGAIIELVAGLLIAAGLFTRCAAFIASGEMAVAYIQFHWKFHFGAQFFPGVNKGELALVYALLFLYVACRGAGSLSIDGMRRKN